MEGNKKDDLDNLGDYEDQEHVLPEEDNKQKVGGHTGVQATSFKDLGLKPELLQAISQCGFEHPSDVQQECIPHLISGRDVLCQAVSGMGKTAVFVLSTLQTLDKENLKPVQAVILCNVKELAFQIHKEVVRFTKNMPEVRSAVFYGGVPAQENKKLLKNPEKCPHIIIATPGRMRQLCIEKAMPLDNLQIFVLDECDKMLAEHDMRKQVQDVFMSFTSPNKQVMMFSATLSAEVKKTCLLHMKDPFTLYIASDAKLTLHGLQNYYVKLEENKKIGKLVNLLDSLDFNQVIIFCAKQMHAEKLCQLVNKEGFPAVSVHAGMQIDDRLKAYQLFKDFKKRIMITTDVLGRGIDIEKINVVINFDMPSEADQYLHRVGRAGRFGTKGLSISFLATESDFEIMEDIQKRFEVKVGDMPSTIDKASYMAV